MSWVLRYEHATLGLVTVTLPNPEFGDTFNDDRRQERGETEAGVYFTQDQGVTTHLIDGTWTNLTLAQRRNLEVFFSADVVNKAQRMFEIVLSSNKCYAIPLGTDMGFNTDEGLNTDDWVTPEDGSLGLVRLDQSSLSFQAISRGRYTLSMRFRLIMEPTE